MPESLRRAQPSGARPATTRAVRSPSARLEATETAKAPAGWSATRPLPKPTVDVARDARFRKLSAADKAVCRAVFQRPAFAALKEAEQRRFIALLSGTNQALSGAARTALSTLLVEPSFSGASTTKQAKALSAFLTEARYAPRVVAGGATKSGPFKLSGPTKLTTFAFHGGKADADRYVVTVGKRKTEVLVSRTVDPALVQATIDDVAKALSALSPASRAVIETVQIEGRENPDDAFWRREYGDPTFRSFMTASNGVVNVYPTPPPKPTTDYINGTMVHETGHILSQQKWGEPGGAKWRPWRAAISADGIPPSTYAMKNANEDFSESLQAYTSVRGTALEAEYRAMMPARFALIDRLLEGAR